MTAVTIKNDWEYCIGILPKVSRTFAINIGHLDGDTYRAVLIGYLIFRMADTFEDNSFRTEKEKIRDLNDYCGAFEVGRSLNERLSIFEPLKFRWEERSHEKELIENGDRVIRCYFDLPDIYRRIIDPLTSESISGMIMYQEKKLCGSERTFQLKDMKDLEDYCYYVAGIVGRMLTEIFSLNERMEGIKTRLEEHHIRFGLALQFVNVIKDYIKDAKRGWCYIPLSITKRYGIDPNNMEGLKPEQIAAMTRDLSVHTAEYLDSALEYIKLLPAEETNIRMFCIIPFVLAYMTLDKIIRLEGIKLERPEVALLLDKCRTFALSNEKLEADYYKVRMRYFISAARCTL